MKYLIVGLGNIGEEYDFTRHNIGFEVVDLFNVHMKGSFKMDRLAFHSEVRFKGRDIHLIKPTTFMNLSGKAVAYWVQKLKVSLDNTLIITDDLALPFGKLRLKGKGSDGGHNGLKSVQESLGTQKYPRFRFGVGNDFQKGKQVDYVLGKFDKQENEILINDLLPKSREIIESFCFQGLERTMNTFNN